MSLISLSTWSIGVSMDGWWVWMSQGGHSKPLLLWALWDFGLPTWAWQYFPGPQGLGDQVEDLWQGSHSPYVELSPGDWRMLEKSRSETKGITMIGTTIGPTHTTKIMRSGVRVADVMDLDILNKIDDIKIGVSYMKTRVRMDSWQTILWFMLRCYDPLIINSFFMELKIKWNFRNKSSQ